VFVTLAIGILLRLDFVLTYLVFFGFLLAHARDRRRTLALGVVPLAIATGGYLALGAVYYGDPLPNTYYLKATGIPLLPMLENGWMNVVHPFTGAVRGGFWVVVVLFGTHATLHGRRSPITALLVTVVLLHWAYFVRIGGDWLMLHQSRFLVHVMPLAIVVIVAGASRGLPFVARRLGPRRARGRRRLCTAVVLLHGPLLVALANPPESLAEWWSSAVVPMFRAENERSFTIARYVEWHSHHSTVVGVFWAGVLPYFCDRPMLDLLGRTDRHIARGEAVPAAIYWPGHAKRDWDYVLRERKPDILMAEAEEFARRPEYRDGYCPMSGPHWLALRRASVWKWFRRDVYIDCRPPTR
jgi:hypothetical protein